MAKRVADCRWKLAQAVGRLEEAFGRAKERRITEPFQMVLWDSVAYLVDDERRGRVFDELEHRVGLTPGAILSAPDALLLDVLRESGMRPADRAARLKRCAEIAEEIGGERLAKALKTDPALARKLLKKFPGVADPGADKILLYNRRLVTLAPDSSILRVLVRLGFGKKEKDYTRTYKAAAEAVSPELPADFSFLIRTREALRRHGHVLCKTNQPACEVCPLAARCPARAAAAFAWF